MAMAALVMLALMGTLLSGTPPASAQDTDGGDGGVNSPATGQPAIGSEQYSYSIHAIPRVTQTLWAQTGNIRDEDGRKNVSFTYQWVSRDGSTDTDIPGATDRSYTLQPSDEGKTIKVRVSFTDNGGNQESLTSEPTVEVVAEDAGICGRTPEVRDSFVRIIRYVNDCALVTDDHLTEITVFGLPGSGVNDPRVRSLKEGDLAGLTNLQILFIDHTDLTEFPERIFSGLSSLRELQISQNRTLSSLESGVFDDLTNLGELRMNANAIAELPGGVFQDLSNLTRLEMWSNKLTSLPPGVLDDQSSLKVLKLSGNQLTTLPKGIFGGLTDLEDLDLAYNNLSSLSTDLFSSLHKLEGLNLSNNELDTLPDEVFNGLSALERLALGENPGSPFIFTADLELIGDSVLRVRVAKGAPVDMEITLAAVGGELSEQTVAVSGGSLESNAVTVTPDGDGAVVVRIVSAELGTVLHKPSGVRASRGDPVTVPRAQGSNWQAGGSLTIYGTPQVGETLSASTSAVTDVDGISNVQYSYQWLRNDGVDDQDILGATGPTHILTSKDVDHTVKVLVTFADDSGNHELLSSHATEIVTPRANLPATGKPQVLGDAYLGRTLAANISSIEDGNGLSIASFSYQWLYGDGTDYYRVSSYFGGNNRTYEIDSERDLDKTFKVEVSFVDDGGNRETRASEETVAVTRPPASGDPNIMATGTLTIGGTPKVGEQLTVDTSVIADENGLTATVYSYTWTTSDNLLLGWSFTPNIVLMPWTVGRKVTVTITFLDDDGYWETLTSEATSAVEANVPAAALQVEVSSNTKGELDLKWLPPMFDQKGLQDGKGTRGDGGSPITGYRIQWKQAGESWDTPGAVSENTVTNASHTIEDLAPGASYSVRVAATNSVGEGPASDEATGTPGNEEAPVWSADMLVVEYTSVSIGADSADLFSNVDGSAGLQVKSLWSYTPDRDLRLEFEEAVPGAADLTLQVGDLALAFPAGSSGQSSFKWKDVDVGWEDGQTISVRIVPTSALVKPPPNTPATGALTISGTSKVDQMLTADTSGITDGDGLTNATFTYQWLADDANIQDATNSTYTLVTDDEGKTIRVQVSFTDDAGNEETLTSAATGTVEAAAPMIPGATTIDSLTLDTRDPAEIGPPSYARLSVAWSAPADNGGSVITSYDLRVFPRHIPSNLPDKPAAEWHVWEDIWDSGDLEVTLTELVKGVNYEIQVRAVNTSGYGPWSTGARKTFASAPGRIEVLPFSDDGAITVTQGKKVDDGGSSLTAYDVRYIRRDAPDKANANWTLLRNLEPNPIWKTLEYTVSGLTNGVWYDLQGRAVNAVGPGPWSETFEQRPAGNPSAPVLDQVTGGDRTLTSGWHRPTSDGGVGIVDYTWCYIRSDAPNKLGRYWTCGSYAGYGFGPVIDDAYLTYTITGLTNNVWYDVRLFAHGYYGDRSFDSNILSGIPRKTPGAPTISGMAQAGETLTVDITGIADAYGLDDAAFAYQWVSSDGNADTDIQDATDPTYTLADSHVGKTIKVRVSFTRVSFTDDGGQEETLTSAATAAVAAKPNSPATGAPTISGTARVGETLTADPSAISDTDGLTNAVFTYQWVADGADIPGVTSDTYTLAATDQGMTISVTVSFTDDAGNEESLTSIIGLLWLQWVGLVGAQGADVTLQAYVTVVVADDLSDPNNPGSSLTVSFYPNYPSNYTCTRGGFNAYISNWLDAFSGIPKTHLGWAATEGTQITSSIPNPAGEGLVFDVEVFCGNDRTGLLVSWAKVPHDKSSTSTVSNRSLVPGTYSSEPPLTSLTVSSGTLSPTFHSHTNRYTAPDVSNAESRVTITTTAKPGYSVTFVKFVTASNGLLHCPWATGVCTHIWRDSSGNVVDPLTDADPDTDGFQVDLDMGENRILMDVYEGGVGTGNSEGYAVTITRASNTALAISGTAQVGETLTADVAAIADEDGLTSATFSYQWVANDGTTDTDIPGATALTYTASDEDVGKTIQVRVSFTDDSGNEETLTSAATAAVAARPNSPATEAPTINGTAQVGETLTADTTGIADEDGLDNAAFAYQWARNDGDADANIEDATGSTYTLLADDVGKTIKVTVSFTDDAGNEERLTSAATNTVAAAATVPGQPEHLNVSPHDEDALDLYWEAPASDGGSPITGYKVQWKEAADSWDAPEHVSEETVTGTTRTINGLTEGVEYAVRVMATNEVGEGPASAEKTGIPGETRAPEKVRSRVDGATLRVLYDEALDEGEGSAPPPDAFDVRVACKCDSTNWRDEEARREVDGVSVDGDTVVLTLAKAATAEDYVVVSYTPPSDAAAARTRDLAGNPAAGFGFSQVFNDTEEAAETEETSKADTPLTASLENRPEAHDGETPFTFELRFSEEFELSYKTLRDHAFTAVGGVVEKAQRLTKGSNIGWRITVQPDADGDVSITLPITEDCGHQGAICTEDGRKLSNRLELTVSGPDS